MILPIPIAIALASTPVAPTPSTAVGGNTSGGVDVLHIQGLTGDGIDGGM